MRNDSSGVPASGGRPNPVGKAAGVGKAGAGKQRARNQRRAPSKAKAKSVPAKEESRGERQLERSTLTLSDLLAQGLRVGVGMDDEKARELASSIISWGAEHGHAGDRYYWPCKFRELSSAERDAAIRQEFNGRNLRAVCKRHGVSHMTVYRAVRQRA